MKEAATRSFVLRAQNDDFKAERLLRPKPCEKVRHAVPMCLFASLVIVWFTAIPSAMAQTRLDDFVKNEVSAANEFILNSGGGGDSGLVRRKVESLQLCVRLLTPLNSNFNLPGDRVAALVTASRDEQGTEVLPAGTILEGSVERARSSGRPHRHGEIFLRFYRGRIGERWFAISLIPDSQTGSLGPAPCQPTGRDRLRRVLIFSTSLAVPLAVGTGGISLAITTGAGAVFGALLAEDRHFVRGAMRGAWEGSGLAVLDPLVSRGKPVVLGEGTLLALRLAEPDELVLPKRERAAAASGTRAGTFADISRQLFPRPASPWVLLTTSARVLSRSGAAAQSDQLAAGGQGRAAGQEVCAAVLERVRALVDQKNLAAALDELEQASVKFPNSVEISELRRKLLEFVSGRATLPAVL